MIWMLVLLISISLNTVVLSALIHHLIIFHCPQLIWILFVFLPMIHCIASRCLNFSRSIEKSWCHFMSNISQTHSMFFIVRQSFLFWNQISYFKDHVNSSLIVEMKSKRYQFWKRSFENHAFWSKTQHTLFNIVLWLSCILKTEMTHCKFKMTFSMVFYVSFNLWSWVYLFTVCNEVTFCEFQETKGSSQNLRIHQERLFSFLAPILSACIITRSLIHEVTTLMEQLFHFWDRHLSVQIAYLIKKGFLKHVMQAMVHGLWKKGKFRLKRCLRVSKT